MVGGDGVDGAVLESGDDGLHILLGPQGGIDAGYGALGEDLILGEGEVLGAGLTGDVDALLLELPDDVHTAGGGDVADVDGGPRLLGEHGVPHDHQLLGDGGAAREIQSPGDPPLVDGVIAHHIGILAVGEDGESQPFGADEGIPHQVGVLDGHTVVGEGHSARLLQGLAVGEGLPLLPHGDGADGPHPHPAGLSGPAEDVADLFGAVHGGLGVGHAGHGGDAPPGSGGGAGGDVLLVF